MDPSFFDVEIDDLAARVWSALARAVADPSHDWHWPTLTTVAGSEPQARTVVLRSATMPVLAFHTDVRTPKIDQIRANPATQWHFYDSGSRVQVRARGDSEIRTDVDEIWDDLSAQSRVSYCARTSPGTRIETRGDGLSDERENPTVDNTEHGRENFAVVETAITVIDWLWLARGEHRRALLKLEEGSTHWLVP